MGHKLDALLANVWSWYQARNVGEKIAIWGIAITVVLALVAQIPWDVYKEHKANREKEQQRVEQDHRQSVERREQGAKQRRRICDELKLRYELFQGRMSENDRTGALRAFDNPDGRFKTAYPDLTSRVSRDLFDELLSLAAATPQTDLSDWPPSRELPKESIEGKVSAFMDEVGRVCQLP